jgi:hypothetical protein
MRVVIFERACSLHDRVRMATAVDSLSWETARQNPPVSSKRYLS